jgi:hypothetical protein
MANSSSECPLGFVIVCPGQYSYMPTQPMQAVVAKLKIGNMIDLAAYAASLAP